MFRVLKVRMIFFFLKPSNYVSASRIIVWGSIPKNTLLAFFISTFSCKQPVFALLRKKAGVCGTVRIDFYVGFF